MNILHLHPGPDTGGQSMGGKRILEAAGHRVRVLVRRHHQFDYPAAELCRPPFCEIDEAWQWSELVVMHNDTREFEPYYRRDPRPLIVHHHGTRFRTRPMQQYQQAARLGAVQVVSTVDLLEKVPSGGVAHWLPQNVDLERLAAIRRDCYPADGRMRLAHIPSSRWVKGSNLVLQACRAIGDEVELVMPRHPVPWAACLRMKATGDIYADQFLLGYGNAGIEAWAMGLPVIAGADRRTLERMATVYPLPFYVADGRTLAHDITAFARSADLRAEWAAAGMVHVRRFHAPDAWLARFEEVAAMAMASRVAA